MKQTTLVRPAPKRTNAPVFWLLFGAGGMLSALFGPALIVITGFMMPRGWGLPANFADYDHVLAFAQNPFAKLVLLAVIALFFWHGAERIFLTLKDMRAGPLSILRLMTYGVAAVLTLAAAVVLLGIGF
ncbi:fumarate reductase subunit FrdD [Tardiphaga sp. vice304]|uniref:fumarate reductase subunit FrdD n=1 Tax=Tardiphaga sp. vice304 TaxID=2592817 RepID=UPI0011626F36|nr:fumarate reductase subunit FrdD [Tardiphaga sp. vice304]QDM26825.1 fumarate reductase subunit FrdD [Tardiphaga sp. vice304]